MVHLLSKPDAPPPHPLLCPPGIARRFLVLAPQLTFAGDVWHRYADEVRALAAEAIERHGADAGRLYLSGFSFGGNGVFDLALLQPGLWAALWAVDPTRLPQRDPAVPVWLSFGEVARRRKADFVRALGLQPAGEAPQGARFYVDEGDDHVGAARRAYADERIYRWLQTCNIRAA